MTAGRHIAFLFNLLQDVNVSRPLVYLAARETEARIALIVTTGFLDRDVSRVWQRELGMVAADTGADTYILQDPAQLSAILARKHGLLIAASESSVPPHAYAHNLLRSAPSAFLRVTLQHGYECVGFLHNRKHEEAYGSGVRFAADVVCGWAPAERLAALAPSESPKLLVTGPTARLQGPAGPGGRKLALGLVCENLHSVRLEGAPQKTFTELLAAFAADEATAGRALALRPHPAGQYVLKHEVPIPQNVSLANDPVYRTPLPEFDYCVSAPSTILLDGLFAEIPVAVWRGEDGEIDAANYSGLHEIGGLADWTSFAQAARRDPAAFLPRQRAFLDATQMPLEPADIYRRFARLLGAGPAAASSPIRPRARRAVPKRILLFVNGPLPTLELAFLKPLGAPGEAVSCMVMTETHVRAGRESNMDHRAWADWLRDHVRALSPEMIVCCRYSGILPEAIVQASHELEIPLVYHIDDDLLNVPAELGQQKHAIHNEPRRLRTIDFLLRHADLVYCSTQALKLRLRELGCRTPIHHGRIIGAGEKLREPDRRPVRRVGYMGFDHAHDFEVALPGLVQYLGRHPEVVFELLGSIPLPEALRPFGERVKVIEPIRGYDAFRAGFAARAWDIGIAPLADTSFNRMKTDLKWVEYASVGAATIASRGMVYDEVCADGRGVLAGPDEWLDALERLSADPEERYQVARRAQAHMEACYGLGQLRAQLEEAFAIAIELAAARRGDWASRGPIGEAAVPLLERAYAARMRH